MIILNSHSWLPNLSLELGIIIQRPPCIKHGKVRHLTIRCCDTSIAKCYFIFTNRTLPQRLYGNVGYSSTQVRQSEAPQLVLLPGFRCWHHAAPSCCAISYLVS